MRARLLLLLLLPAGCGHGAAAPVSDTGAASVGFSAGALPQSPLSLTAAGLELEDLALFGDVQAAPGYVLPDVAVDLLAPSAEVQMDGLPEGVYSRVRFSVESLQVSGQWRDRTLQLSLVDRDDDDDVVADLRLPSGGELTAGQTMRLTIAIDAAAWFAGVDLDGADVDSDQCIRIGGGHNDALVAPILAALPGSFTLASPIQ